MFRSLDCGFAHRTAASPELRVWWENAIYPDDREGQGGHCRPLVPGIQGTGVREQPLVCRGGRQRQGGLPGKGQQVLHLEEAVPVSEMQRR